MNENLIAKAVVDAAVKIHREFDAGALKNVGEGEDSRTSAGSFPPVTYRPFSLISLWMAAIDSGSDVSVRLPPAFVTTHWSVVLAAAKSDTASQAALENLCHTYWYPLYAYVRRRGHSAQDAQDLTQAFFARLLERHWVGDADRERGRFRTFLLTAMSRFMADEWDKVRAQKRGGGVVHVPLQLDTAETRYGHEPADNRTPEQYFERRWALTLLDTVLQRLRAEYEREGKGELFAGLNSMSGRQSRNAALRRAGRAIGPVRRRGESGRASAAQALSAVAAGGNRPNHGRGRGGGRGTAHLFAVLAQR